MFKSKKILNPREIRQASVIDGLLFKSPYISINQFPLSLKSDILRNDIRKFIRNLKKKVGLENNLYFPIPSFVENGREKIMNEMITETIRKYEVPGDFTHTAVSSKMIATAEHVLKIKLPEQYISFFMLLLMIIYSIR